VLHLGVVIIDTSTQGAAVDAFFLGKGRGLLDIVIGRTMQLFLKDRVGVKPFELGLEITEGLSAAVGSTTVAGEIEAVVLRFVTLTSPVALTTTLFLHTLGVGIDVAMLGEVARETVFREGGAVSKGAVVAVVPFVGTGHDGVREVNQETGMVG